MVKPSYKKKMHLAERLLYTAGADRTIYEIDPNTARLMWGTLLPSPVIALLADEVAKVSAMDSQGNLYRLVNRRRQCASPTVRRGLLARLVACLLSDRSRFG